MDKDLRQEHELRLWDRGKLTLTGVKEVESFDENVIALNTVRGLLLVRGEGLHLRALTPEGGQVTIDGGIQSLSYEEDRPTGGFFRRLFT